MKIAIIGAGAMGSIYAALLADSAAKFGPSTSGKNI